MQAFTNAVKGAFGYGPVATDKSPTALVVAGADSHPPPRHVPGTEPQAGEEPEADAVLRAQAGLTGSLCGLNWDQLPPGLKGGLGGAAMATSTMATVLVKEGSVPLGTVVGWVAAAGAGGLVIGGFLDMAYRASTTDGSVEQQP